MALDGGAQGGDREDAGERDQAREQRVLDQILALLFTDEAVEQIHHCDSLLLMRFALCGEGPSFADTERDNLACPFLSISVSNVGTGDASDRSQQQNREFIAKSRD
jgi:hypothetical protein